jgi:uncharacterized membrane protein
MERKICILLLFALSIAGCNSEASGNAVADMGDIIKIQFSQITKEVQFFTYDDDGVTIKYFAVLSSDGQPRTAFDACDVCGGYKGYTQVGADIKCNNCGKVFSIDGLGTKNTGYGCWPSYLPNKIIGNDLVIKVSDIQEGRKRFI